jgi:hypothetical protein
MARIKAIKKSIIGKNLVRALSLRDIIIVFWQYNQLGSINIINLSLSLEKDIYKLGLILDIISLFVDNKEGEGLK